MTEQPETVSRPNLEDRLKWAEFLAEARERMHIALQAQSEDAQRALEDLRFCYEPETYQWDDSVRRQRMLAQRPCLVFNQLPAFIGRVKNQMRMNRYSIIVRPKDGDTAKELADLRSGLIRTIEEASDFEDAQDTAGQLAVACGRGWMRVGHRYASDDSFEQEIYISALPNAFCVTWDPASKEPDLQDAEYLFVYERISKKEFRRRFPGFDPADVEAHTGASNLGDWDKGDSCLIAEYWYRGETKTKKVHLADIWCPDGRRERRKIDDKELKQLEAAGAVVSALRTRKTTRRPWMVAYLSGVDVLDGPIEWPGKYHPIVPVWGERINIDGKTMTWGVVRHMRDAQRSYNYSRSAMVERVALEPKAPWVIGKNQVKGLEAFWERSRTENLAYLPYNDDPTETGAAAPPQRVFPESASGAVVSVVQLDKQDLHDISGIQPTAMGKPTAERSGVAIAQRRAEGDLSSYVYPDNMAKAVRWVGRILLDLIPHVYDSARVLRLRTEDGREQMVPVNASEDLFPSNYRGPKVPSRAVYERPVFNDMSEGSFDLVVDVGPQVSTQRQEVLLGLFEFMKIYPPAAPILGDLLAQYQDWPGSQEIQKRLRKLVPPGVRELEEGEQPPPAPPPDPKIVLEAERLELERQKLQFEMIKADRQLGTERFSAEAKAIADLMRAEAAEIGSQVQEFKAIVAELSRNFIHGLATPGAPGAQAPGVPQQFGSGTPTPAGLAVAPGPAPGAPEGGPVY